MALDRTLVQIRERSFLDVLDLSLVVVRNRPLTLGLAALAGIAPFAALNAWLTLDVEISPFRYAALVFLEVPWATAPLSAVLGNLMFGHRPTPGQVIGRLVRALPALLAYQLILRGLLTLAFIFLPLIPVRLWFLNEVILLERAGWRQALRRSSELCSRRGGDLLGQWMAQLCFGTAFVACFWYGTGAAVNALTTSSLTWDRPAWGDLYGFRFQLAIWLAIAFFTVARFLTYIDHRIRKEGWEIRLRLQDVGRALEEGGTW